jgi:hypothetical protein
MVPIPDQVVQSFSQLSIIPEAGVTEKKPRTSKYRSSKPQQTRKAKKKKAENDKKLFLPDYLNVPNRIFKKMFIAASEHVLLPSVSSDMVDQWLDISSNMKYIREQAHLLDKLLYLQLQQSLWTEYFHIGTLEDGVWASEVQEKISRQVTNKSTSISSLSFVAHYRVNIEEQLQATENDLNNHLNRFNCVIGRKSQVQCIDLSVILKAFIRKGQHKLNAEFECKKRLLHFDYQDHRLTKAFFDLKPTKKQV